MSNKFNYKYSVPTEEERKEIDSIRRQYLPIEKEETKIERLRRLDGLVKNTATIWSLVLGVVGTLVFGFGLTMILEWEILFLGIVLMVLGCPIIISAYPIYKIILKKNKDVYGEEIIKLSEELLNEKDD